MHPGEEQLNDYVDGALEPADQAAVAAHLDECAPCALLVAQLQRIVRDARALPHVMPPPEAWARIEKGVRPLFGQTHKKGP